MTAVAVRGVHLFTAIASIGGAPNYNNCCEEKNGVHLITATAGTWG
jgi:hypothetical protein